MSYYKTNDPAVLAAWAKNKADRAELQAKVDAFAARFGGKGLMYADPARFAGIKFPVPLGRDRWTAPDEHGLQRPRSRPLKGASPETKASLKELNAEWQEHYPDGRVSVDPIYKAMGHHSSLDFILGGVNLFVHDGWLYAKTGHEKMPKLTEILGSEYDAALQAFKS